jgi:hypothetical protein
MTDENILSYGKILSNGIERVIHVGRHPAFRGKGEAMHKTIPRAV